MIDTIQLKFGRALEAEPLHLRVGPITVFVGPNNAGKSRLLKELKDFCGRGRGCFGCDLGLRHFPGGVRRRRAKG